MISIRTSTNNITKTQNLTQNGDIDKLSQFILINT